jgi:hypothetical protein
LINPSELVVELKVILKACTCLDLTKHKIKQLRSCGRETSTVAEHLLYHPKVKGLCPGATVVRTGRKNVLKRVAEKDVLFPESKYYQCFKFKYP